MHTFQRLQKALLATLAVTTFFVLPTQDLMASSPRFMVISMFNNDLQIATDDNDHDLSVSFALVGNQTHVHVFYGSNTKLAIYGNHIDSYSYGANVRSFVIQGRIDDVRIYLGDGDDQFFMRDYRPTWNSHGDIDVETGGGNNVVELQSGYCRSLEILGGRHDDEIILGGRRNRFAGFNAGSFDIQTFEGDDRVVCEDFSSGIGGIVELGDGWDDYEVAYATCGGVTEIRTGNGDDFIYVARFMGMGDLILDCGEDEDAVALGSFAGQAFQLSMLEIYLGHGDDRLANFLGPHLGGYHFDGGRGTDMHVTPPPPFITSTAVAPWANVNFERWVFMPSLQAALGVENGMEPHRQ